MIPGLFDGHNKAFFFVNYEELRQPSDVTRNNRTVLNPAAQARQLLLPGGAASTCSRWRRPTGRSSTVDPIVGKLLADIRLGGQPADRSATSIPTSQRYTFNVPVESMRRYPTFRLDYNVTQNHRASFAYNYQKFTDYPDTLNSREPVVPGLPGLQPARASIRLSWSRLGALDAVAQPRQRGARRLQRRAGQVLRAR